MQSVELEKSQIAQAIRTGIRHAAMDKIRDLGYKVGIVNQDGLEMTLRVNTGKEKPSYYKVQISKIRHP